jgi:sec-independent protein translocase protein TatA
MAASRGVRFDGRSLLMPSWIGPWEIAIVVVLILLIFGPRKLPELGSSIGKSIRGFKKGLKDTQDEVKATVAEVRETPVETSEATQAGEAETSTSTTVEPDSNEDQTDKNE